MSGVLQGGGLLRCVGVVTSEGWCLAAWWCFAAWWCPQGWFAVVVCVGGLLCGPDRGGPVQLTPGQLQEGGLGKGSQFFFDWYIFGVFPLSGTLLGVFSWSHGGP